LRGDFVNCGRGRVVRFADGRSIIPVLVGQTWLPFACSEQELERALVGRSLCERGGRGAARGPYCDSARRVALPILFGATMRTKAGMRTSTCEERVRELRDCARKLRRRSRVVVAITEKNATHSAGPCVRLLRRRGRASLLREGRGAADWHCRKAASARADIAEDHEIGGRCSQHSPMLGSGAFADGVKIERGECGISSLCPRTLTRLIGGGRTVLRKSCSRVLKEDT